MLFIIKSFLKYSTYIGHSASNSLFLSSWFFYKLRKRVWIINLFKTIIFLKLVFKFLQYLALYNLPFWYINLELSKEYLFKKYALSCGEFACTKMWIRGFLSNFKSIQNSLVKYIFKKHFYKFNEKENLLKTWSFTRFTWPRGAFLSNIPINYVICKEAASILLPVVALVDTNIKSFLFTLPVPSNDDSIESINFILSLISKKLLLYKYKKVISWYQNYKHKNQNKKVISRYNALKDYLNMKLGKRYRAYKRNRNKTYKRFIFFSFKGKKYKNKKVKFRINKLTNESKQNLRNDFFSKDFWYKAKLYSKMQLLKSKKSKKNFWCNLLLNKTTRFYKNNDTLIQNTYKNNDTLIQNTYKNNDTLIQNQNKNIIKRTVVALIKGYNKSKYLSGLNLKKGFYNKFLLINNLNLKQHPTELLYKTIRLKYFKPNFRRRVASLQKLYSYYYFISNNLRKSRVFHETFFKNLPSKLKFIRSFHKYDLPPWVVKKDTDRFGNKWYWYNENYRYLNNERSQKYWQTNRRNQMLFKYWKYNKKLSIADSAVIYPLTRWVSERNKLNMMRRIGRFLLKYWLMPFFRPFIVKEKNRWYKAHFFSKEDITFKQHFNWNWPSYKTPLTTFHYYNNWFSFLVKENDFFIKQRPRSDSILKLESWRRIRDLKQWRKLLSKRRAIKKAKIAAIKKAKIAAIKKAKIAAIKKAKIAVIRKLKRAFLLLWRKMKKAKIAAIKKAKFTAIKKAKIAAIKKAILLIWRKMKKWKNKTKKSNIITLKKNEKMKKLKKIIKNAL